MRHASIQTTLHTYGPNGPVDCVVVKPDIDYYKDLLAHSLPEVLPNTFTKGLTDPRGVYFLRWMACRQGGLDFNPLFTIITPSRSTNAPSSMTISDSKRKLS